MCIYLPAVNQKSNVQYVTEGYAEKPQKNPGEKNITIAEKLFTCGRETDVQQRGPSGKHTETPLVFFNIYLRAFTNQYDVREQEYKRLSSIPEPVWTLFLYTVGQVDGTGTPINL